MTSIPQGFDGGNGMAQLFRRRGEFGIISPNKAIANDMLNAQCTGKRDHRRYFVPIVGIDDKAQGDRKPGFCCPADIG